MANKPAFAIPVLNDDGSQQWAILNSAFSDIYDLLKEHAEELKALAQHNTSTISFAIENNKATTILKGGKHLRGKIINAYTILGDSAPEETKVWIQDVSETVRYSNTEKTGKVKTFKLLKDHIHFSDTIIVQQTGNRKLIVNLTLESEEEQ